jgi:deoxyribonuclease V
VSTTGLRCRAGTGCRLQPKMITMIACVDVHYQHTRAVAAGIAFRDWLDDSIVAERVVSLDDIQPYRSGQFFIRELPCLLAVLQVLPPVQIVLIDGYVWLDENRPGLGAYLYESFDGRVQVIGVAKTRYSGADDMQKIERGNSKRPLYISAVGLSVTQAAEHVYSMHGPYRIPTLLKRVDLLSRAGQQIVEGSELR